MFVVAHLAGRSKTQPDAGRSNTQPAVFLDTQHADGSVDSILPYDPGSNRWRNADTIGTAKANGPAPVQGSEVALVAE